MSLIVTVGVAVTMALFWSSPARAAFVEVNCDGGKPGTFTTIFDALASLAPAEPTHPYAFHARDTIQVTGTCIETVAIYDRTGLTLEAPPGETFTIVDPNATGFPLLIGASRGIYISGLVVTGGTSGIVVFDGSEVDFDDCTIDGHPSTGLNVQGKSMVFLLGDTTVRNNGMDGIYIAEDSEVGIFGGPTIEGNGRWGVNADFGGSVWMSGASHINGNGSMDEPFSGGIRLARGARLFAYGNPEGAAELRANLGPGILAGANSTVALRDALLQDNDGAGVRVQQMSIAEIIGGNAFGGNVGGSISCDGTSLAFGDLADVENVDCEHADNGSSGGGGNPGQEVLCHCPPGNSDNCSTITVGAPAIPAHLAHGDAIGECTGGGGPGGGSDAPHPEGGHVPGGLSDMTDTDKDRDEADSGSPTARSRERGSRR